MMRLSELGDHLLVCHKEDTNLLNSAYSESKQVLEFREISVFSIGNRHEELSQSLENISKLKLSRYLDRFYMWMPEDDSDQRQEILDDFFELVAEDYDSLIDVERNLENIQNLLEFLDPLLNSTKNSTIVDYGCGTGLSLGPISKLNVNLIGVDRCPTMRQIAMSRGMRVWGPGDLAQQPKGSFDGAFASYVLHLLPHMHGIRLLWSRLKLGGMIVANFHKNRGMEIADTCIRELRGTIQHFEFSATSERHGVYVAYLKEREN